MIYRKKIVAGNWKMNKTQAEARALVKDLLLEIGKFDAADIVLCPPFTALSAVSEMLNSVSNVRLGAQNMHEAASGAYTGEISAGMLRELYVRYVIIGHSERRQYFHEDNATVNRKAKAAIAAELRPIVCIGETLPERESNKWKHVFPLLRFALRQCLADTHNRPQFRRQRRLGLAVHRCVVLVEILPPLRVADNDVPDVKLPQHPGRNFPGIGARRRLVHVLRPEPNVRHRAEQVAHHRQGSERRAKHDLRFVEPSDFPEDVLHEHARLGLRLVHFPVPGDDFLAIDHSCSQVGL